MRVRSVKTIVPEPNQASFPTDSASSSRKSARAQPGAVAVPLVLGLAPLLGPVGLAVSPELTAHCWEAAGATCAEVLRHGGAEIGHPRTVEAGAGDEAGVVEALGCVDGYV